VTIFKPLKVNTGQLLPLLMSLLPRKLIFHFFRSVRSIEQFLTPIYQKLQKYLSSATTLMQDRLVSKCIQDLEANIGIKPFMKRARIKLSIYYLQATFI